MHKEPKSEQEQQERAGSKSCDWALMGAGWSCETQPTSKRQQELITFFYDSLPNQHGHAGGQTPNCSTAGLTVLGFYSRFSLFFCLFYFLFGAGGGTPSLVHVGQILYPGDTSLTMSFRDRVFLCSQS